MLKKKSISIKRFNNSTINQRWILHDFNVTLTRPIIQSEEYYPFGLTMAGTEYQRIGVKENRYLYNGKELQNDLDLNWYDYGARFYDPQIGRWTTPDPLSGKDRRWSQYVYGFDNAIRFEELDGMWPTPVHHNLLDAAFGQKSAMAKIISKEQLSELKRGSDRADSPWIGGRGTLFGNQSDAKEYIHGMKPKNMSVAEAKKSADNCVSDHVKTFVQTGDFEQLGEGLHTLMDETSPAHRDQNGTPLEYNGPLSDHGSKEDPDDIEKNDGQNGYITVKGMNEKFKKAEIDMQAIMKDALKQREEYVKEREKKERRRKEEKINLNMIKS